ncbi:MAG: aldo/keto reductase [Verrucomicrobia bacterium]|nr:MAG: aldo/keto reductase [Verrucomicrobiota bacterium]
MKYRPFGKSGREVSEIGFGAWAIGGGWGPQAEADSLAALRRALELGVNFIDTAAGYGNGKSERTIAEVLAGLDDPSAITVATKTPPTPGIWPPSPYCDMDERYPEKYLRENVAERMEMLRTDRIDILQLHTWTRAWNRDPRPFRTLRKLQEEGKIGLVGVSTPEHDQNAVIDLIRNGWIDSVQLIYNLFEQEPAAELLDTAAEHGVGVIVRVPFDEGSLTGKFTPETVFPEDDFRRNYFAGDRLERCIRRVDAIREDLRDSGYTLPQAALKFILAHPAVSVVIPGMRNALQAGLNCSVSELPDLPEPLLRRLRRHNWRRAFWYSGK